VLVLAGGFAGSRVHWRGDTLTADGPVAVPPLASPKAGLALKEDVPLP
jgi:hypothetical protein